MHQGHPKNIGFLTGVGVATDSGTATFRAAAGMWLKHSVEEIAQF